jgi:hypothetical protein
MILCYHRGTPIPRVIHKQFDSLLEEYKTLALKTFKDEYDALKLQREDTLRLLQEAEETLEDCLASCPDILRWGLNENIKKLVRICNNLMDAMHKSEDRYEKELERIQALLPKCPHCEDIKEEELEQMQFNYYRDMVEHEYSDEYDCTW